MKKFNVLKVQLVSDLKRAFNLNLTMCGLYNGEIMWLGYYRDLDKFKKLNK